MNSLDIAVIVIVLLSGGLAFMRGFIREMLSIVSWIGAVIVAFYLYAFVAERVTSKFLPPGLISNISAAFIVFLVTLIILSILTAAISRRVSQSKLSSFDRVFGLIFGLVRGAVLMSLVYLAIAWFYPEEKPRPDWISNARTLNALKTGGDMIVRAVPQGLREKALDTANQAREKVDLGTEADTAMRALIIPKPAAKPAPDAPKPAPSYNQQDQKDMNRLIQQQQGQ